MGLIKSWHCYCDNPRCQNSQYDVFDAAAQCIGLDRREALRMAKSDQYAMREVVIDGRRKLVCRECVAFDDGGPGDD